MLELIHGPASTGEKGKLDPRHSRRILIVVQS